MNQSTLDTQLQIDPLNDNVFITKHPLWRPSGARGIFGGVTIAQSLKAAQLTVPTDMNAHSMHCCFVSAGSASIPITYHVERVRDGRSFSNRSVKAIQNQRTIFLAMISFTRTETGKFIEHVERMPHLPAPPKENTTNEPATPYINHSVGILNNASPPSDKRIHQWIKARGAVSETNHLASLAFMSDSYFLAAIPHVHNIWHFVDPPLTEFYGPGPAHAARYPYARVQRPHLGERCDGPDKRVGMMVSLDHTIYFHHPRGFSPEEWILSELQTHWAGDGRGVIMQKMWTREGVLIATCVQEGIVRLEEPEKNRL
ncbi:hypothetical protein AWENTII_012551 [Aspergillus wentii]|nr:hypothetical protein MW887_002653 [Aspergillus wentii]